jgi:hypothetical protein
MLLSAEEESGSDVPDSDFYARGVKLEELSNGGLGEIDRVVLVYRMREAVAQVGFPRFEQAMTDINGELDIGVRRADLATDVTWLSAVENRGKGVFSALKTGQNLSMEKFASGAKRALCSSSRDSTRGRRCIRRARPCSSMRHTCCFTYCHIC